MDPLLPSTSSFEDFLNNPLPEPPSFQFDEYKPETAVQPKKKRKRNDEAPSLTFCPLQKESWPTLQNEQGLNTTNCLLFSITCPSSLTQTTNYALIHYKRNQLILDFQLLNTTKEDFTNWRIVDSDLQLKNLAIELQIIESTSPLITTAFEQSIGSSFFLHRSPVSHKVEQIPLLKLTKNNTYNAKLYFDRATTNNGSKKQCYFYVIASLVCTNSLLKCSIQNFISIQPLIIRGGNPAAYDKEKEKTSSDSSSPDEQFPPTIYSSLVPLPSSNNTNSGSQWESLTNLAGDRTLYTNKRVGINNDNPKEALSVGGNIELTGEIYRPSDQRIKRSIVPLNPDQQLDRIRQVNLYDYERQDLITGEWIQERGVLAQELSQVMPSAVTIKGDVILPNGQTITNFCTVSDRTLMIENIGATQAIANKLDIMDEKINQKNMPVAVNIFTGEKSKSTSCFCYCVLLLVSFLILSLAVGGVFSIVYLSGKFPNDDTSTTPSDSTTPTPSPSPGNSGNNGNGNGNNGNGNGNGNGHGNNGNGNGNNSTKLFIPQEGNFQTFVPAKW